MTLKVRDEEDILDANLRYHVARGVDFFIVTDNGSVDGTREILDRYEQAGLARVIDEPDARMTERGQEWLTHMARLAGSEHGADWILHDDADEFWWPLEGSLHDALASIDPRYGAVYVPRVEFMGRPEGPGSFAERLIVRERIGQKRPKIAHRPHPHVIVLRRGAHDVTASATGDARDSLRPVARTVNRATHPHAPGDGSVFVPAPRWPIRILHFPLRSAAQHRRRMEMLLESDGDKRELRHLRAAARAGRLDDLWDELVTGDEALAAGLESGELVEDTRLRDFLAHCPDPLAEARRIVPAPVPSSADLEHERAVVEEEAMATLARHTRMVELQFDRSRQRIAGLRQRAKRLRLKLRQSRGRR